MKVEQLMTSNVETCGPEDSLEVAAKIMWERDCGFVPVIDGDRHVQGVITDRDICIAAYTKGERLQDITVRTAMAHEVYCCRSDDSVFTVEELMREAQVRRVPVIDEMERLVGVVSLGDIAREAWRDRHAIRQQVTAGEIASTLAAISAHTHPNLFAPGA